MKKVHFIYGCPWADGSIQQADTDQRFTWKNVTCKHCLNNAGIYGRERRAKHYAINPETDEATDDLIKMIKEMFGENYENYL